MLLLLLLLCWFAARCCSNANCSSRFLCSICRRRSSGSTLLLSCAGSVHGKASAMGTDDPAQNGISPSSSSPCSSAPVRLLIVVGGAGGSVVVVSKLEEADRSSPPPADHDQDRIALLGGSGSVVGAVVVASRIWSLNETIDTFLPSSPGIVCRLWLSRRGPSFSVKELSTSKSWIATRRRMPSHLRHISTTEAGYLPHDFCLQQQTMHQTPTGYSRKFVVM